MPNISLKVSVIVVNIIQNGQEEMTFEVCHNSNETI
jgi:hypothetical protein